MFFLTPPGMFVVLVLLIIKKLLHDRAYHRPEAINLNALSRFVDRVVWVVFWWVIVSMIIQYNDWQSFQPSSVPVHTTEQP